MAERRLARGAARVASRRRKVPHRRAVVMVLHQAHRRELGHHG